ncbi:SecDF P1 head subdomain-containing protein [Nioella aestuarii]|uniref:SecDF P1 head subdomain-containing protein n=1 Tax=Nioella aestuarii TaxID=1662864 RepID=UPI003D7FF4EE
MEPEGLGFLSGIVTALGGLAEGTEGSLPPPPIIPQPGGAAIELRLSGVEYAIAPESILAVLSGPNEITGVPQVELILDDQAATLFGQITTTHLGQEMDLIVCSRILVSPVIREPITGGRIMISGNFTPDETDQIAHQIAGGVPCDPPSQSK